MKPVIGMVVAENPAMRPSKHIMNTPYIAAVIEAGGIPVLIPADGDPSRAEDYIGMIDGLLLPGGEDVTPALYGEEPVRQVTYMNEDKDRIEIALIRLAMERKLPIFGICRGMQLLATTLGGKLYQDLPSQKPECVGHAQDMAIRGQPTHSVTVEPGSLVERLLGEEPLRVNSFHHQGVREVPAGFRVTATAVDGIPEAMENTDGTIFAVQWHPEELVERYPRFRPLFAHLVDLARNKG